MSATPDDCLHLSTDLAREIHAAAIARFGGSKALRDPALLESAVAAPRAGVRGKSLFRDLAEVAAAYLFYLSRNDPFHDGNKRAALGACLTFLRLNGISLPPDSLEWKTLTPPVRWTAHKPPPPCGRYSNGSAVRPIHLLNRNRPSPRRAMANVWRNGLS